MSPFEPRLYQQTIVGTASLHNTLVVLPTGLGKTHISIMLAEDRIAKYPDSKILILAPTKPLVDQHAVTFAEHLPDAQSLSTVLTGRTAPEKRADEFRRATFIFSTPQTIENDLLSARITLADVSLLVLDEAHRATGDYAYVYIAKQYRKTAKHERILALTASPGSDQKTIAEIVTNVAAEKIEVRTPEDPDVKPYVQDMEMTFLEVDLPAAFLALKQGIDRLILNRLTMVKQHGHIRDVQVSKSQLLGAQAELQAELRSGDVDPLVWRSISILAEVMKAQHAVELIETQGVAALNTYLQQLQKQAEKGQSKAVRNLVSDPEFQHVRMQALSLAEKGVEHPKFIRLVALIRLELTKNPDAKIIVFSQYRDMAQQIVARIGDRARLFVGQQKKGETGLSQKEQKEMLAEFRGGEFPVLVATAVGEEGLDIPAVDLVVFYEPVPSAVRTIQRRGRTGRHDTGRVIILVAKGTRDVGYRWAAHHKELRMHRNLKELSRTATPKPVEQQTLADEDEVVVYADAREKGSGVLKELQAMGVRLVLRQLDVGDYVLSKRVAVEFKTAEDFVNSILDGRLLAQMGPLTTYQRPLVVVQGGNWYEQRNVHPNAIRGALSAIAVSFGVPILVTQNDKDTAALLHTIARRESQGGQGAAEFISSRAIGPQAEIVSVVASLPNVGPVLAPKLLARFGSLKALINASVEELLQVDGVGKKKAQELHGIFARRYGD